MLKFEVILLTFIFFVCCGVANGKVLFVDDFERDTIGEEPSNWEQIFFAQSNSIITIDKDPQDAQNLVARTTGVGIYLPKVAGREDWKDYIWDFDWMWENDSFVGTVYRFEDSGAFFHGSRRTGGVNVEIYTNTAGAWTLIAGGQYPNENNVWYSHRLIIEGDKHEIYLKERDDDTPFEELEPIVEAADDMFESGPVGMLGITDGVSYFDNMVVAETVQDIEKFKAVDHVGKLTITWGSVKVEY